MTRRRLFVPVASSYDKLAAEYYSEDHLTSRNFDDATARYLKEKFVDFKKYLEGTVVDIGCGRGQLSHFFPDAEPIYHVELDVSMAMLNLPRKDAPVRIRALAEKIPLRDSVADITFSFLFDPFNLPPLEQEVRRITKPGGMFIGTMPSLTWAGQLRKTLRLPNYITRFTLTDGTIVEMPSYISSHNRLKTRFRRVGFADVEVVDLKPDCTTRPLSRHVVSVAESLGVTPEKLPLVTFIQAS